MIYRGKRLVPAECSGDYDLAREVGCNVDVIREERAACFIDMVVALERIGCRMPHDATKSEIIQKYIDNKAELKGFIGPPQSARHRL